MSREQVLGGMRWGVFGILIVAFAAGIYAGVLSVVEMSHSVVGGVVGPFLAVLLLGAVSWRIQVKWKQLRSSS